MSEPRTAAMTNGISAKARLHFAWSEAYPDEPLPKSRRLVDGLIAAIESEARQALLAELREAVEGLPAVGGNGIGTGGNDEAILTVGPMVRRAAVLALLTEEPR